jgi:hypothetical protein
MSDLGCDIKLGAENPLSIYRPTILFREDESQNCDGGTLLYNPDYNR